MVRTDTRVQRLEAFLHPTQSPNEKKRPPSPDVDDSGSEGDPATEFVSFEKCVSIPALILSRTSFFLIN